MKNVSLVCQCLARLAGSWRLVAAVAGLGLALTLAPSIASAEAAVWRVSKGEETVYVAGTIHLLRAQDYPLPPAYELAYQEADRLFFEIDLAVMSDMSVQTRMMQQLTYQDGRTLATVLDDDTYAALQEYVSEAGLPMPMLENFKPGLLLSTLSVVEFQKMGFTPQGVDAYYHTRALGDAKPREALETIDEQIAMLAAMGEGYESEFVMYTLRDMETAGEAIEDMIAAWRAGDQNRLEEQFIQPMLEEAPELYNNLLVERNNNWMPQIEAMFDEEGTELVLVGAAHLVGEHGLLAMLSDRGYEVTAVSPEQ